MCETETGRTRRKLQQDRGEQRFHRVLSQCFWKHLCPHQWETFRMTVVQLKLGKLTWVDCSLKDPYSGNMLKSRSKEQITQRKFNIIRTNHYFTGGKFNQTQCLIHRVQHIIKLHGCTRRWNTGHLHNRKLGNRKKKKKSIHYSDVELAVKV